MTYGNISCTAADRGTSHAVEVMVVNEDNIYNVDPEFRYLALSLTVKNRFKSSTAASEQGMGCERCMMTLGAFTANRRVCQRKGGPDIITSIERQNEIINFRLLPCYTRVSMCMRVKPFRR